MADMKVLLVDDEEEFAAVLRERMSARGLQVDTVTRGEAALEKASSASYDAIILDLRMPGMDGIETLKRLRGKDPDLQIIMLTGHGSLEKGVEAVKLGAADFLEKPADMKHLMEKLGRARDARMLLVNKRTEERIREILQSKGW